MKNKVKQNPIYTSIINGPLILMDLIDHSMHDPIWATYTYLSLTEPIEITIITKQQEKEGSVEYMERFKQEKIIVESQFGENISESFVETPKKYKKLYEVDDADEIFNMKKNAENRKHGKLKHYFSVQYAIKKLTSKNTPGSTGCYTLRGILSRKEH